MYSRSVIHVIFFIGYFICALGHEINVYEEDALEEFRHAVKDLTTKAFMKSDGYLLRWLKAGDFNAEKTISMFQKSMEWRKERQIDTILHENFTFIDEVYPYTIDGFDKNGRPLFYCPFGIFDIRKIAIGGKQDLYQRGFIRMVELGEVYLQDIRDRTGKDNITQVVAIFDLAGFNLKQGGCLQCLNLIPEMATNFEPNYPGIFYRAFYINTPSVFLHTLQLAKTFMTEDTKAAIQVFGYDKENWVKALLQQIEADQIPMKYGGTKPNPVYGKQSFKVRNAAIVGILGKEAASVDKGDPPEVRHGNKSSEDDSPINETVLRKSGVEKVLEEWNKNSSIGTQNHVHRHFHHHFQQTTLHNSSAHRGTNVSSTKNKSVCKTATSVSPIVMMCATVLFARQLDNFYRRMKT